MVILLIDTATERGLIACIRDNQLLFSIELPLGLQNSQILLPQIEKSLKLAGLSVNQLNLIVVGRGPGSYTGIRVCATVAKTLSYALQIPLVGVCSLELFIPDVSCHFAVVIDARIAGVYLQKGYKLDDEVIFLDKPLVCPLSEAANLLHSISYLITPNATLLKPKLEAHGGNLNWHWQERYPSPMHMASLGKKKFLENDFSLDGRLELLYMRATQAEINRIL